MQLNVLNDLAEAMKALDGKKWQCVCYGSVFFLFVSWSCHTNIWVDTMLSPHPHHYSLNWTADHFSLLFWCLFDLQKNIVKSHAWENQQHACYYGGTPMCHRKTACFEALVLEPYFAQSCARFLLLYCLLAWRTSLQCLKVAAHVLVKPWFAAPPPCTFHCFVRNCSKHAVDFPMRETWLCIFCK